MTQQVLALATLIPLLAIHLIPAVAAPSVPQNLSVPQYAVTVLGSMVPQAINNVGQVAGEDILWDRGRVTRLGRLVSTCSAMALNDSGQVVGISGSNIVSAATEHNVHAFLWRDGKMTDLGTPTRSSQLYAFGINKAGDVVGSSYWHPVLWRGGRKIPLPTLVPDPRYSTIRCEALALNNHGLIVGYACDLRLNKHAVVWHDGHILDLGWLPGSHPSTAVALNAAGKVVGDTDRDGTSVRRAFLWFGGKMRDLGALPGAVGSQAFGINDSGQTVGQSGSRAVLWRGGRIANLNDLVGAGTGWVLKEARAINNRGQIVGWGDYGGQKRAFLLTPTRM